LNLCASTRRSASISLSTALKLAQIIRDLSHGRDMFSVVDRPIAARLR
jgi:hypothetical protein